MKYRARCNRHKDEEEATGRRPDLLKIGREHENA
jgi:hypothetical protein